jgi:hypothetical protein
MEISRSVHDRLRMTALSSLIFLPALATGRNLTRLSKIISRISFPRCSSASRVRKTSARSLTASERHSFVAVWNCRKIPRSTLALLDCLPQIVLSRLVRDFARKLGSVVSQDRYNALRDGQASNAWYALRYVSELMKSRVISSPPFTSRVLTISGARAELT